MLEDEGTQVPVVPNRELKQGAFCIVNPDFWGVGDHQVFNGTMNYTEVCFAFYDPLLTLTILTLTFLTFQWMCLKEWQAPPKWLLVEDSNDLFRLWRENHCYQEIQDQNIATLSIGLDSLVREKVALEERLRTLELRDEVMWGLVDSLVRMGEAQPNRLDPLQPPAHNFIGSVMEWDAGGGRGNVPSDTAGSLGPGYVPSGGSGSSPPSLKSLSSSSTRWSELVSPITPNPESGRAVAIEEVETLGHSFRTALSAVPDSEIEEFGDPGLPGDGGSGGDMGGDSSIWRGT